MAAEALSLHVTGIAEDGEAIPEPSTLDALAGDPGRKGAVAFLVLVEPATEQTVRINITARAKQIEQIDKLAVGAGMMRSAYMVQSALNPRHARRKRNGPARRAAKGTGRRSRVTVSKRIRSRA